MFLPKSNTQGFRIGFCCWFNATLRLTIYKFPLSTFFLLSSGIWIRLVSHLVDFCVFQGADKKKKTTKLIELPMDVHTHGFLPNELSNLIQQEAKMVSNDAKETERIDAKNALEEFVYDMRNKLQVNITVCHSMHFTYLIEVCLF